MSLFVSVLGGGAVVVVGVEVRGEIGGGSGGGGEAGDCGNSGSGA